MEQKKGIPLNQAFGAVLTLVLVAILVIISIVIFVSLANTTITTESATITSESISPVAALAGANNCSSGSFSIASATNETGGAFTATNYTVSSVGLLSNTSEMVDNSSSPWIVNYSYNWGGKGCEASQDMVTEFSNYTSLIGLVGTIIFLGLVIGVLVASFAFGGRREV